MFLVLEFRIPSLPAATFRFVAMMTAKTTLSWGSVGTRSPDLRIFCLWPQLDRYFVFTLQFYVFWVE